MSDAQIEKDGFGNWCPTCGEQRGVCRCAEFELPYFWIPNEDDDDNWSDNDGESIEDRLICPKCNGTGIYIDDIEPCDHCDGMGYEWWLP